MNLFNKWKITLLALLFCAAPAIYAQTATTGDIAGVVKDSTDAVVPGATVTLKSTDTGDTRTATTGDSGAYRFTFLRPGNYVVSAAAAGLKSEILHVTISVGQIASADLVAKVQSTQEVVEVSATGSVINTENANLSATFNSKQIQDLPTPGGDLTAIALSVPGIAVNTGSAGGYGNFSSHGLPGNSNLFTINGNDYNDPYLNLNNSGSSNITLGQNEIQEAAVVQNAYGVQYGRQAGAQVNYTTLSGTNAFHGNLVWNWNGDRLNANNFFNNAQGVERPKAISNQWAARIGGRIIKDKLFFFADTEGIRYVLPTSAVVVLPSAQFQQYALANVSPSSLPLYKTAFNLYNNAPNAGSARPVTNGPGLLQDNSSNNGQGALGCGAPGSGLTGISAPSGGVFGQNVPCASAFQSNGSNLNKEWLMTYRVDYNVNDKQKLNFRYKTDHGQQPSETNLINSAFNVNSIQPQHEGQVNYTYVISPTMVNNFIGSALWYSSFFQPVDTNASLGVFPTWFSLANAATTNAGSITSLGVGGNGLGLNAFPQGRNVGQLQLSDDFSIVKGNHTIKLGVNFRKNRVTDGSLEQGIYGFYTFNSLLDFANGLTNPSTGTNYNQNFTTASVGHMRLYNVGFYAQDEWAARPNLKITLGVRIDRTGNPSCVEHCFSNLNDTFSAYAFNKDANTPYNQVIQTGLRHPYPNVEAVVPQPRMGVVWSPRGSSGTVIRGGVGLFADLPPGILLDQVITNTPNPYTSIVVNGAPVGPDAQGAALAQYNAFKNGFANGATLAQLQSLIPGFTPPTMFSLNRKLLSPKYIEWSFELQQPIGTKNVFVATYSGNHGYDLLIQNGFVNAWLNTIANGGNFNAFGGLPTVAPAPAWGTVTEMNNTGRSNYNGLSVSFRRAYGYGIQGEVGYTWSHSLDNCSNGCSPFVPYSVASSISGLSSPSVANNYGNSDYDVRHQLQADFVWDLPWKFNNRLVDTVLGGWTVSSKFYVRSGTPFSIVDTRLAGLIAPYGINATMLGSYANGARVHQSCGASAVDAPCFGGSDFLASGSETDYGNVARNSFFGPGYFGMDSALYKRFAIRERMHFLIGATAFNLLNHTNLGLPANNVAGSLGTISTLAQAPTSAYGSYQGSAVSGRIMVLNGRFEF